MNAVDSRGAVRALLADCKRFPLEDRYRLVLADWLDEYGNDLDQARAELIRCQIQFSTLPVDHSHRDVVGQRANWLQRRHVRDWLGPLGSWVARGNVCERGLFSLVLQFVALQSKALRDLADSEAWAWVESLRITDLQDDGLTRLKDSPLLAALNSITLSGDLGPAGMQCLLASKWLDSIVRLDLSYNPLTNHGLSTLTSDERLAHVRELSLASTNLTAEAGAILSSRLHSSSLHRLNLTTNQLLDLGLVDLSKGQGFGQLRSLELRGNRIGDEGVLALARTEAFPSLQSLDLRDNFIGPEGALALCDAANLDKIQSLSLYGNPIGSRAARRLIERFGNRVLVTLA